MGEKENRILVLGVGNLVMGDEGVGIHFIRSIEEDKLPEYVDLLDGGTAGFQLMSYLQEYPVVVLVDASIDGREAGQIDVLEPAFSQDFPTTLSAHDIGLKDVIEACQLSGFLPKIYLFTVSIDGVQPMKMRLSPPVESALPVLRERVFDLIKQLQIKH